MIHKIDYADKADEDRIEKEYGGYNYAPPNWKEIKEEEFTTSHFFTYTPKFSEYRQIIFGDISKGEMMSVQMFYFHDGTGVALYPDWREGKVRYFKFAKCDHDSVELTQDECKKRDIQHFGMCWHVYECKKCGYIESYDSSG